METDTEHDRITLHNNIIASIGFYVARVLNEWIWVAWLFSTVFCSYQLRSYKSIFFCIMQYWCSHINFICNWVNVIWMVESADANVVGHWNKSNLNFYWNNWVSDPFKFDCVLLITRTSANKTLVECFFVILLNTR